MFLSRNRWCVQGTRVQYMTVSWSLMTLLPVFSDFALCRTAEVRHYPDPYTQMECGVAWWVSAREVAPRIFGCPFSGSEAVLGPGSLCAVPRGCHLLWQGSCKAEGHSSAGVDRPLSCIHCSIDFSAIHEVSVKVVGQVKDTRIVRE